MLRGIFGGQRKRVTTGGDPNYLCKLFQFSFCILHSYFCMHYRLSMLSDKLKLSLRMSNL